MPINLNKIDPVIISNVQRQTAEGVVNKYENIKVKKDTKDNRGGTSHKRTKEKIDKFNSILEAMDMGISLIMDGDDIIAVDINGNMFKRYTKEAVIELFNKMEDMIGIFVDTRK